MEQMNEPVEPPAFAWDHGRLIDRLASVRYRQGRLNGRMESLGQEFRRTALARVLADEVVHSGSMEDIALDEINVRVLLLQKFGRRFKDWPLEPQIEAPVGVLLDATSNYQAPVTEDRLLGWHYTLMLADPATTPTGGLGQGMAEFLEWIDADISADPVLKAGLAHLWFMTIHPFPTGSYRIAAAVTLLGLARAEGCSRQYVSLSRQIWQDRVRYWDMVQKAEDGTLEVTEWLLWFLDRLDNAITASEAIFTELHQKEHADEKLSAMRLNDRQREMLDLLRHGIEDQLTTGFWASRTNSSPDTALREIKDLVKLGLLKKNPDGGRSTSYSLVEQP